MNERKIRTRRRPRKGGEQILRAITSKRHRSVAASPAAGFNEDGQSSSRKITLVLFAILLIHLAAVGAIFLHSKLTSKASPSEKESPVAVAQQGSLDSIKEEEQMKISKDEAYAWVYAGDNYQTIAQKYGVEVEELKKLNKNRAIEAGQNIRIPVRKVEVVESEELHLLRENTRNPGAQTNAVVKPVQPTPPSAPASSALRSHSFVSGETLWSLSRRYGVSVDQIKSANPGIDPRKIRAGQLINIPTQ